MAYSTYDDYAALYGVDELTAEAYAAALPRATALIDTYTARRAQTATGYKLEAVKRAECGLVRLLNVQDETEQGLGLQSVSNDGYSEHYASATPDAVQNDLRQACFGWLSGTGLMSAL